MRPDIVALLKSSKNAFICGLIGIDPVATFRWAVLRAYFRAMVAFRDAGKRHVEKRSGESNQTVTCTFVVLTIKIQLMHFIINYILHGIPEAVLNNLSFSVMIGTVCKTLSIYI